MQESSNKPQAFTWATVILHWQSLQSWRDENQVSCNVGPLELANMDPRETALKDKGEQQSWQICTDVLHRKHKS